MLEILKRQLSWVTRLSYCWRKICPESGQKRWLVDGVVTLCFSYCLLMTDKRQKATKVKCKREESSNKPVNICGIWSSLEDVFEFCWSSLTDEHNTLPKPTRRHIKLDKFIFGTLWLRDLLCKHWLWNFCRWVADVPPRETSPAAKGEEKQMFSQDTYYNSSQIFENVTAKWTFCVQQFFSPK